MARPNIVRADTIDLQDPSKPSAAEHPRVSNQNGLAPHQRAEVSAVIEERHSEEIALSEAWTISDNTNENQNAIDEAQERQEHRVVEGEDGIGEVAENGDSEEVDGDDDLMDRISSSPSIDEGAFSQSQDILPAADCPSPAQHEMAWPDRKSSLSPSMLRSCASSQHRHTSDEAFNQSPSSDPDPSSSFVGVSQHSPLAMCQVSVRSDTPLSESQSVGFESNSARIHLQLDNDESSLPSVYRHHHQSGRYRLRLEPPNRNDETLNEGNKQPVHQDFLKEGQYELLIDEDDGHHSRHSSVIPTCKLDVNARRHIGTLLWRQTAPLSAPFPPLDPSGSLSSIASINLQDILLPVDDPLLDPPPSPCSDSSTSWESFPTVELDDPEEGKNDDDDDNGDDDDTHSLFTTLEDRFIDSGWGGECLRETEDIDFEFVYALHTFVATVEGQANATKGDTMVLLDDSNSYWWLVRVVKDTSIGYLPAEHIETPSERLARLNKHRNIDLSATMLSDNSEKTRNPLKKAMKRRNAKTVQFAAPTYVEASDYEFSTDDEDTPMIEPYAGIVETEQTEQEREETEEEPTATEQKSSLEETSRSSSPRRRSFDREQAATAAAQLNGVDEPQLSPKLIDKTEAAPLKSRKGTPRNADSFLKDDNIETRKITLTPGLLREDSPSATSASSESQRTDSLDGLIKQASPPDQLMKRDSKREKKDKKPGMLSGLFKSKKKEKKSKDDPGAESDAEKPSMELVRDSPLSSPALSGRVSPSQSGLLSPEGRNSETLSRQRSSGGSPSNLSNRSTSPSKGEQPQGSPNLERRESETLVRQISASGTTQEANGESVRENVDQRKQVLNIQAAQQSTKDDTVVSPLAPLTNLLKRDDSKSQKPTKAKRAKQRVELDDFDSPIAEEENPFKDHDERQNSVASQDDENLSDSPVEITPGSSMHATESVQNSTPGLDDRPKKDNLERDSSLSSSPSIIEHPADTQVPHSLSSSQAREDSDTTPTQSRSPQPTSNGRQPHPPTSSSSVPPQSHRTLSGDSLVPSSPSNPSTLSPSVSQQSWSDTSLRSWLDDGSEIKDMLIMIHDKTGVVPVADDHPLMAGLFTDQRKGVQDMLGQLDGLLGSFLQRKGIKFR